VTGLRSISHAGLAVLGGCFVAAAVALAPFSGWGRPWIIPAGFALGLIIAYFAPKIISVRNGLTAYITVLGTTLLTGSAWLLLTRVSPEMSGVARDFLRFYETAAAFAASGAVPDAEYQAIFPHLQGYPFVLSLLFRVFGVSVAAAQAFNLFLSLCIAALLLSIGKKLMGVAGGFTAGMLWALLPSHFMLLSLVAGEPLHITLTLCAVRLYLWLIDCWRERLPYWILLGAIVGVSSLIRPIGPVYLLAFAIHAAVFVKKQWRSYIIVLAMVAAYLAVTAPFAGGFGWNFYVGMNRESGGEWNAADQEVMNARMAEGLAASEIQALFQREAFERLGERLGEPGFTRFMAGKFQRLWCQDSFTVYWLSLGMRDGSPLNIRNMAGLLSNISNIFYGFLLGCCALSIYRQVKTRREAFTLPMIILTGVMLLFLLLEANPRYRYAGSAALCLLAAGCVTHTKEPDR
jgi:hypothetical protein